MAASKFTRTNQTVVSARQSGLPDRAKIITPAERRLFDKIGMSAFEGTWLNLALRDCGISAFIIVGVATEIGIEPTVRHGADLGYIPIVIEDACGSGDEEAAGRAIEQFKFIGDAFLTNTETICELLLRNSVS